MQKINIYTRDLVVPPSQLKTSAFAAKNLKSIESSDDESIKLFDDATLG